MTKTLNLGDSEQIPRKTQAFLCLKIFVCFPLLFIYWMCVCRSHSLYMEIRMTFGSWFSSSSRWVLDLELWLWGLAANTLPYWASLLVLRSLQTSPRPCAQVMHSLEIAGSPGLAFVPAQHQSHQCSFILWAAPPFRWLCLCHSGWLCFTAERCFTVYWKLPRFLILPLLFPFRKQCSNPMQNQADPCA